MANAFPNALKFEVAWNRGSVWKVNSEYLSAADDLRAVRVLYLTSDVFLLAVHDYLWMDANGVKFYRTTDGGATWTLVSTFSPGWSNMALCGWAYDSANDVVVVAYHNLTTGYIYRSTNRGDTWTQEKDFTGTGFTPSTYPNAVAYGNSVLLVGGTTDLGGGDIRAETYKSTNGGDTWASSEQWSAASDMDEITCLSYGNSVWIAGAMNALATDGEIWKSTDGGDTWSKVKDLGSASPSQGRVLAVRYGGTTWLAGTGSLAQIWKSTDDGATWSLQKTFNSDSADYTLVWGIDTDGSTWRCSLSGWAIMISTDAGATWTIEGDFWHMTWHQYIGYGPTYGNSRWFNGTYPDALLWEYEGAPTWSDETSYLLEARDIKSGRPGRLNEWSIGTAAFVLDNQSRRFSPRYTSGALYGKLNANSEVRLRAATGYAAVFDGSDDYLQLATDVAAFKSTAQLTVFARAMRTGGSGWQTICAKTGVFELQINGTDGIRFVVYLSGVTRTQTYAAGTAASTWYDICGIFDGENAILYVGGAAQDTDAFTGYLDNTSNKVTIGALSGGTALLTGKIKEVAIWSMARSPVEVALLTEYGYGWLPVDDFLLGWWNFTARSGADSSAGGNTMVASGAPSYAANSDNYTNLFYGLTLPMELSWQGGEGDHGGRVALACEDRLGYLSRTKTRVPVQTNKREDEIITAILDAFSFSATARILETGSDTIGYAGWDRETMVGQALQRVADRELGGVLSGPAGSLIFFNRDHWRSGAAAYNQLTVGDSGNCRNYLLAFQQGQPEGNEVGVDCVPKKVEAETTLWTFNQKPLMTAGKEIVLTVHFTDSRKNSCLAVSVTAPVATTDYTANTQSGGGGVDKTSEMSVTVMETDAKSATLKIKNTGTASWYITSLKIRGTPGVIDDQAAVIASDGVSQERWGIVTLSGLGGGDLMDDVLDAAALATYLLANCKDPHDVIGVTFQNINEEMLREMLGRRASDRVGVSVATQGIDCSYNIGALSISLDAETRNVTVVWALETPFEEGIWVLGGDGVGSRFSYETLVGV